MEDLEKDLAKTNTEAKFIKMFGLSFSGDSNAPGCGR